MEREEQRDLWRPYLSTHIVVVPVSYLSSFSRNIKTLFCGSKFVFRSFRQFCQNMVRDANVVIPFLPDEDMALSPFLQGNVRHYFWHPSMYFTTYSFCVLPKKKKNRPQEIRWHPWTWPPSLAPIFSTSRRARTRSSACRAQPGPRRARRSSLCCRGWSPASKPSSRSAMCISNIHSSALSNTHTLFHILAQALEEDTPPPQD